MFKEQLPMPGAAAGTLDLMLGEDGDLIPPFFFFFFLMWGLAIRQESVSTQLGNNLPFFRMRE